MRMTAFIEQKEPISCVPYFLCSLSGHFTTDDWIEEGYDNSKPGTSSIVCPIIPDRELVLKVIERRLKAHGVDVVTDDEGDEDIVPSSEGVEENAIITASKLLKPEEPSITTANAEILQEATEKAAAYPLPSFVSNLEVDEDSSENRKKRRRDTSRDRSTSPDLATLSATARRKKFSLKELTSRLSHTSKADLDRTKRQLERARLLKERAEKLKLSRSSKKGMSSRALIPGGEDGRVRRETSAASSSSSCFSPSETIEQFEAVMANNPTPRPARGRGLSRGRGRGGSQISGRGRGRGRGRPASTHHMDTTRPWPNVETPPQSYPLDTPLSDLNNSTPKPKFVRGSKAKANGEEVKKRPSYKRKKPALQHLPTENNLNETPTRDLKGSQETQPGAQAHSLEQQRLHGNKPYYDPFNYGQTYNPNSNSPRPHHTPHLPHHHHHHQNELETPSKIRQKTKHTVIIQDPHESIPSPSKHTPNFVDYKEANLRHSIPNQFVGSSPPNMSSVIVRAPAHSGNTPPKIMNPMGMSKTHVTITQNPKSTGNYYSPSKGLSSPYEAQQPYNSSTPPSVPSNYLIHKKRTQNLAAATTYTPQPDSLSYSSDGSNSEFGQQPHQSQTPPVSSSAGAGTGHSVGLGAATASSLAVRSRQIGDAKLAVSSTSAINTPSTHLPAGARTLTLPVQSNSTTPVVHQRKAQPHILATTKLQRNAAAAAAAASNAAVAVTNSNSNSGATTPVPGSPASSSSTTTNSSVTPNLTPGGSPLQTSNSTVTNFVTAAASSVMGKTNVLLGSSPGVNITRAPGPSPNIIFVQKNPSPSSPGQVIASPSNQPGAVVCLTFFRHLF